PATNIIGSLRLPGDKSVSHRYAMLGALAQGTTRLANFSTGADCASTLSCLHQLGCTIRQAQNNVVEIEGRQSFVKPSASLDCGAEDEGAGGEPCRTRAHAAEAVRACGAELTRSRNRVTLRGGQQLHAIDAVVPGDISSAAFFLWAASLFPSSSLVIETLLLN